MIAGWIAMSLRDFWTEKSRAESAIHLFARDGCFDLRAKIRTGRLGLNRSAASCWQGGRPYILNSGISSATCGVFSRSLKAAMISS